MRMVLYREQKTGQGLNSEEYHLPSKIQQRETTDSEALGSGRGTGRILSSGEKFQRQPTWPDLK